MAQPKRVLGHYGNIIIGSVLDCDKGALERSLKFYDSKLYLKWNPNKRQGRGVWEIRRQPEHLTAVYQGEFNGSPLHTLEYKELDIVHHVLDLPILRYDALQRIKEMDVWGKKTWIDDGDYEAAKSLEKIEKGAREELKYSIKQHKQEWRDFARLVSEGQNPGRVLNKLKLG